jgi:hypothetical protein
MYFQNLPQGFGTQTTQPQQQSLLQPIQQPAVANNNLAPAQAAPQLAQSMGVAGLQQQPPNMFPAKTPVLGLPSMAAGGATGRSPKERDMAVKEAQIAASGKHPAPHKAMGKFASAMGVDALGDLQKGGRVRGSGGGVDDLVPASIDGREDIRIAAGEYIIPARVVSALGDGDTDRGVQILDEFVERVRAAGSSVMQGSDSINPESLLPEV